ncbi:hypothetical protein DPX16_12879 [Anabarilius grahami]|uniref:Uncharacterized protein n=1 Tax=Anabarilius grahami TaxID=495550 RepID=A0A3N0XD55_ANAGA|nr:hypothetical protein DPX16_12879 [Anabarilius grahami]
MERSNYTDQRKLRTGTRKRDVQLGFSFFLSGFGSVDFNECLQDLSEDYFGPIVCLLNWAVAHQSDSWLQRGSQPCGYSRRPSVQTRRGDERPVWRAHSERHCQTMQHINPKLKGPLQIQSVIPSGKVRCSKCQLRCEFCHAKAMNCRVADSPQWRANACINTVRFSSRD